MTIYLVEGEQIVKQRVLFFVEADNAFDASRKCRTGKEMKRFVISQSEENLPTNFNHLGTLDTERYKNEL